MATTTILIKRYARSRLYDTINRRYVTLDELREWSASGSRSLSWMSKPTPT
jgi:polyhydroxyalkanoate synthesis regulator protein